MSDLVVAEKAHAKYSASGSKRWRKCLGSTRLVEKAPPQVESRYGIEGTNAHSCLEYLVRNRKKRLAAAAFLRGKYPLQMVVHAETALNWIEERLRQLPGAELLIEQRCELPVSEPGQFGTTDIAIVQPFGKLIIADYKYGAGIPVFAFEDGEENSQLAYYALGLAWEYDCNFTDVELVVIQPRAEVGGETIRSHSTTMGELLKWREKFETAIQASKKPNAPLLSGDHCRFCPAAPICPEIKNKALRAAQADFDDETGIVVHTPPARLAIKNLPTILPALDDLERWIASVRQHAEDVLTRGGKIEGYTMVDKRPQRVWADLKKTTSGAKRRFGDTAFTTPELASPAQLEKIAICDEDLAWIKKHSVSVSSGLKLGRVKT